MARNKKWELQPQRSDGRIYYKGKAVLIILPGGFKTYYPDKDVPVYSFHRNKKGQLQALNTLIHQHGT